MNARLQILSAGALTSVQDAGRFGLRRMGVPWSGILDRRLMRIANRLAGNTEDGPVLECFDGGQQFTARDAALRIAVAGDATLELDPGDGQVYPLEAWRSFVLEPGQRLRIRVIRPGRIAAVAVVGLTLSSVLGSVSTYARAVLGGLDGRTLASGDTLPAASAAPGPDRFLPDPPGFSSAPIRLVAGPQREHFSDEAWARLVSTPFRVGAAADRMGVRLDGPALDAIPAFGHEIVSDATVPGSVQVPASGQPIVLLADGQTAGGYAKIATVVSADLHRLAAMPPGTPLRFAAVDAAEGVRIARDEEACTREFLASIRTRRSEQPDLQALYTANLVDGVISARTSGDGE